MAREVHHNTPEQAHHYLEQALVIVNALELSDDLRAVAFTKACDLIASKQIFMDQGDVSGGVLLAAPPNSGRMQ